MGSRLDSAVVHICEGEGGGAGAGAGADYANDAAHDQRLRQTYGNKRPDCHARNLEDNQAWALNYDDQGCSWFNGAFYLLTWLRDVESIALDPAIVAFMNNPKGHILIATLKCVHLLADVVINMGLPTTATGVLQRTGRAGREGRVAWSITYTEKSFVGVVKRMDEAAARKTEQEKLEGVTAEAIEVCIQCQPEHVLS